MKQKTEREKNFHNRMAPYWAATLFVFAALGLSTIWLGWGAFGKGYLLDMTGPAWNYILFRGLNTTYSRNAWTRFFTPLNTLFIFLLICFGIEAIQYLQWYDATFDPLDLVAYISLLFPVFILDLLQNKKLARQNSGEDLDTRS